jgi:FAD/FMN-containing dehydrogenase
MGTTVVRSDGRGRSRHAQRVAHVAAQLSRRGDKGPASLKKKAVSHQVPKRHDRRRSDDKIDIGDLREILAIDPDAMTCTAEPGATFEEVVAATLAHGLVPLVVPELKTITVGGAVSGCSIESMSFKYGGFHDTCLEYEVITGSGEVLHCTPNNEHKLVFQMLHGSFGTLGILSKLVFRLTPAKPFVHVRYASFATLEHFKAAIWEHFERGDVDFMDGFIHSPSHYVLCLGTFVERAPYTNRYDWMKVYYRSTARRREDYLRTADYLFRYDNGVTNVHPKSAVGRLFLGKFIHSAQLLRMAEKLRFLLPKSRPPVTIDLFVPFARLETFIDWYEDVIDFFPVWVVPYRRVRDYEWLHPSFYAGLDDALFIDLAIYGMKQRDDRNYYKLIEDELQQVNGLKTLISHNYYDEDVFWSIWNRDNHLAVKKITDPNNIFRDLYQKTCRAAQGRD